MYIDPILEKDGSLSKLTNQQIGFFCKVLALAGQLEEGGRLGIRGVPLENHQIIKATNTPQGEGEACLMALADAGVISKNDDEMWFFPTWTTYQDEYERKRQASKSGQDSGQNGRVRAEQSRADKTKAKEPKKAVPPPAGDPRDLMIQWWKDNYPGGKGEVIWGRDKKALIPFVAAGNTLEDFKTLAKAGWECRDNFTRKKAFQGIPQFLYVVGAVRDEMANNPGNKGLEMLRNSKREAAR